MKSPMLRAALWMLFCLLPCVPAWSAAPPPAGLLAAWQQRDAHRREADRLAGEGRYAEALQPAARALQATRAVAGGRSLEVAAALSRLADLAELAGQLDGAERHRREELELREQLQGKEHWQTSDARRALASVRRLAGLGERRREQVLAARRAEEQALRLEQQRRWAESERVWSGTLEVYREQWGAETVEVARVLYDIARVRSFQGNSERARKAIEEALAIRRKALPRDHPLLAQSLNGLGIVQWSLREYEGARKSHEEALAIRRKVLPSDHPALADSLNNLGLVQRALREYEGARQSQEEALAIRRKTLPNGHPDIASSLNNLGIVQYDLREYEGARQSHEEALAIRRKTLPKDHPKIAQSLTNLGNVQWDLGEYEGARQSQEEALAIRRKALPGYHPEIADSLNNLALAQKNLREYEGARQSHEEALAIYRKALPRDELAIARSLNNLGVVQKNLREYEGARKGHEEALAIFRKALPRDHPEIATNLNNLGIVQKDLGEYEGARQSHEEALAIRRKALPKDHPQIADSLTNLGGLGIASGKELPSALRGWLAEAIDIRQQNLSHLAIAQAEAEQFRSSTEARESLDLLLSLATSADPEQAATTYDRVVGFKGAVTARQRWARRSRDLTDPGTADLLRQLRQANRDILAASSGQPLGLPGRPPRDVVEDLRELTQRRARLERELAARSPAYRAFLEQGRCGLAEVRDTLPEGAALIDLVEYTHSAAAARGEKDPTAGQRVVAFVVRPGQKSVAVVPLGSSKALTELIDRWRASYGSGKAPPTGTADPGLELRKKLWEPLAEQLGGAKLILVAPDGPLNGLPLAALPGSRKGTFLIHEHAFAVVPVPQLLPDLLRNKASRPAEPALLAVGDIDFDARPGSTTETVREDRFLPLPGTRAEAAAVHALFRAAFAGRPAELLTGQEATREAFVNRAPRCSHLLVATHGFFLPEPERPALPGPGRSRSLPALLFHRDAMRADPELRSGLVFAGANRATPGRAAPFLTAREAADVDLGRVDLAVLSACETGLGKVQGTEGVLGLQRAFQLAGARTTVTSLWKVPDAATQALMTRFHRNLWQKKGETPLGKLEALREAQLWLLREGQTHPELLRGGLTRPDLKPTAGESVSPFYWAAFVLSGDWR